MSITGEFLADFTDFIAGSREAIKEVDKLEKKGGTVGGAWASAFKDVDVKNAFADPLGEASAAADVFVKSLGPIAGIVAGVAAAVGAAAVAIWKMANSSADAAAKLGDLKETTGISVPELSRLSMAADVAGTDVGALSSVVYEMNKRMAENPTGFASALNAIGIEFKEFVDLKPADRLLAVADGLRETADQGTRNVAGTELMGKQYKDMAPALLDVAAAADQVAHINPFTEEDAQAAKEFKTQIAALKVEIGAFTDEVGRRAIPALTKFVEWLRIGLQSQGPIRQQIEQAAAAFDLFAQGLEAVGVGATTTGPAIAGLKTEQQQLKDETNALVASLVPNASDALKQLTADVKGDAVAMREADAEAAKFAAAMDELDAAGTGWRGTLDGINGAVAEAVKYYLDAGVSQAALATAYELTAVQVKAVAAALAEEKERTKELRELEVQRASELLSLYQEYDDAIRASANNSAQARIDAAWRAADAQVMAMAKAQTLTIEAYDVIQAKAKATADAIANDTLAQDNQTRTYYERLATKAAEAYAFALQHASQYTTGRVEQLRLEANAAEETLNHWQAAAEAALTGTAGAADQAAQAIGRVTGELERSTAAASSAAQAWGGAGPTGIMTDSGGVARDLFGRPTAILPPGSVNMGRSGTQIVINGHVLGTSQELARVVEDAMSTAYRQGGNRLPA